MTSAARRDFDAAAQSFWTQSIELCKKLRPRGLWSWYNYPTNGDPRSDGWLYDAVDVLLPSIYLYGSTPAVNAASVDTVLNITRQVRDGVLNRTGRPLPMYSYAWLDYDVPPSFGLLEGADLQTELARGAARWGLNGVIVWSATLDVNNATLCATPYMSKYITSAAGPAILAAAKAADACASSRCSSHGTCWGGPIGSAGACDCDAGWGGNDCSKAQPAPQSASRWQRESAHALGPTV